MSILADHALISYLPSMHERGDKKILIICKKGYANAHALGLDVAKWLQQQGYGTILLDAANQYPAELAKGLFLAVVLGGDGTMLGLARHLAGSMVPIVGINFGRVGFLTACTPENWQTVLASFLDGKLPVQPCLCLQWRLFRESRQLAQGMAINDVVLGRGTFARLVSINVEINGDSLGAIRGDALVISTPIGTSGYCHSAGGPLLAPEVPAIVAVPVCPFRTAFPPTVLADGAHLRLVVEPASADCHITIDGQEGQALATGDVVEVVAVRDAFHLVSGNPTFYERLCQKNFITG